VGRIPAEDDGDDGASLNVEKGGGGEGKWVEAWVRGGVGTFTLWSDAEGRRAADVGVTSGTADTKSLRKRGKEGGREGGRGPPRLGAWDVIEYDKVRTAGGEMEAPPPSGPFLREEGRVMHE